VYIRLYFTEEAAVNKYTMEQRRKYKHHSTHTIKHTNKQTIHMLDKLAALAVS